MPFSEKFIEGLNTKSNGFQNTFYGIIDYFYEFFEYDEKKIADFERFIESEFTYYEKGNQLYSTSSYIGGKLDSSRCDEYMEEIYKAFIDLFTDFFGFKNEETGIYTATNIIIAANVPKDMDIKKLTKSLEFIINLKIPDNSLRLTIYTKNDYDDCANYFFAVMK